MSPFTVSSRNRIFRGAPPLLALFAALFFLAGRVEAGLASSRLPVRETLAHQRNGNLVEFALSERPSSVALQGLAVRSGRWVTLKAINRPPLTLAKLTVPRRWRETELRVVATFRPPLANRKEISSEHDPLTRGVTFLASEEARLFSVEARVRGAWTRVSTVAAPESPKSIRVALPASLPAGARIRVVAVSGTRRSFASLATPLSSLMRSGPVGFAPALEAVSEAAGPSLAADVPGGDNNGLPQAVEESDIWRVQGERIYFFNRLRGLQVIDVSNTIAPRRVGHLPMAGVGEEMYVMEREAGRRAVLLTSRPWSPDGAEETMVSLVAFAGDAPVLETVLPVPGHYVESRLVGNFLHVVTRPGSWDSASTTVTTISLAQAGSLVEEARHTLPFAAGLAGSTGKYLWVSGESGVNWWQQKLAAFPYLVNGSLADPLTIEVGGRVQDKFKVGDTAEGLAVVVQNWAEWPQATLVETFRADADALVPDGKLELVRGESLFASRFDGNRLYAVTFEQVDPLWIVDLSDPSKPAIDGHLEVPGWSFFIQPMGDVLLAVGRDQGIVQVSMFDVSDPANPLLAGRVDIGEGWSQTEAEWNEKAVKILPESGLLLVPAVETLDGKISPRVSLVDFDPASRHLAKRGNIDHAFEPRRAALMESGLIASVSNRELFLVDISDRDRPQMAGELELANGVDLVLSHEGHALLIENGDQGWSGTKRNAVLRIAHYDNVDAVKSVTDLGCQSVAAVAIFDGLFYVVEKSSGHHGWLWARSTGFPEHVDNARLSVWSLDDVSGAPALVGRMELPFAVGGDVDLLPVDGGRVAVVSREQGWHHVVRPLPLIMPVRGEADAPMLASLARIAPPFWGWGGQGLRVAVVESGAGSPTLAGQWDLPGDTYSMISEVFSAGDRLVFSFAAREQSSAFANLSMYHWKNWETRHWLQVLDLADPSSPMPWAPVQLPGQLLGISWLQRSGGTIFARSEDRVAAVGFDGENASVVAEVPAGPVVAMQDATLYFPGEEGVEEWKFSEQTSRWNRLPGWPLSGEVHRLYVSDGAILAQGHNQAWVLGEDGPVSSYPLPWSANLGTAARIAGGWMVPAGEYGVVYLR